MGNKDDFDSTGKVVSTSDAQQYARQMNITFYETSAKDNRNVHEAFNAVTRLALQQRLNERKKNSTIVVGTIPSNKKRRKKCWQ